MSTCSRGSKLCSSASEGTATDFRVPVAFAFSPKLTASFATRRPRVRKERIRATGARDRRNNICCGLIDLLSLQGFFGLALSAQDHEIVGTCIFLAHKGAAIDWRSSATDGSTVALGVIGRGRGD